MKVLAGLVCANSVLQAYAISPKAYGYIFDSKYQPTRNIPSISPVTARLLFAQRLGLSQFHSLDDADEGVLKVLNEYGLAQDPALLDDAYGANSQKLLIFVENVEHPEDLIFSRIGSPIFEVADPPWSSQNLQLALDLLNQERHRRIKDDGFCSAAFSRDKTLRGGVLSRSGYTEDCFSDSLTVDFFESDALETPKSFANITSLAVESTAIYHISSLEGLTPKDGNRYKRAISELNKLFQELHHSSANRPGSTIVLMPPSTKSTKRSIASPYGTSISPSILQSRQSQPEKPLSAQSSSFHSQSSQSSPSSPSQVLSTSTLPNGILPICHSSLQSCISQTNNCSGHGTPYQKANAGSEHAKDCWACKCIATTRVNKEGKVVKTTQWGGPACQKKDVSVPFFLLAGFTIAILATVSWAVGLLFSVGQEKLPSVIGAGVAGPRAQK